MPRFLPLLVLPFLGSVLASEVLAQGQAPTFAVVPELTQEQTRTFLESSLLKGAETVPIDVPAEALIIQYSAEAPFELWVSFPTREPFVGTDGSLGINPFHVLKAKLQPLSQARISIDLTRSPAWYAGRRSFVLHVLGEEGKTVLIHELTAVQPTVGKTLGAYLRHFFIDEPVLLSSINFLSGYWIADTSVTFLLGSLFLAFAAIVFFTMRQKVRVILLLSLACILLYDARVSLDLTRVTAQDLTEWREERMYRQLGPIHRIAAFLEEEGRRTDEPMRVVMCFDGTDFLQKQLRYLLYPIPVLRPEEGWKSATHAVFMDTDRWLLVEGMVSCGEAYQRRGELLQEFPQRSRVVRFQDVPA